MAQGSGQPFIMPDGWPLGAFLQEDGQRTSADATRRRGSAKSKKHGQGKQAAWDRSLRTSAAHAFAGAASSEADRVELEAISRVGRDRRRRWLNDKILRDMAGAMTASDMDSLFKPPPFGGTVPRPSALTAAALPENMPLWDLFRNIDMEKQHRVLMRWEVHVAGQRGAAAAASSRDSAPSPALAALQAWAGTSRKARDALRRASLEVVHALETRILREVLGVLPPDGLSADVPAAADGALGSLAAGDGGHASHATAVAPGAATGHSNGVPERGDPVGVAPEDGSGGGGGGDGSVSAVRLANSEAGGGNGQFGNPKPSAGPAAQSAQPRELQLTLPDGFHRLLVHGIAQFHGLASFSRDAAGGGPPRASPPSNSPGEGVGTAQAPAAASPNGAAMPQPAPAAAPPAAEPSSAAAAAAEPADDVTVPASPEQQQSQPHDAAGAAEAGPRITVVRRQQQGDQQQMPADELITVSDILLVMDGSGGGLTAAMLEVPATPDSRNEPWAIAAAAHAAA